LLEIQPSVICAVQPQVIVLLAAAPEVFRQLISLPQHDHFLPESTYFPGEGSDLRGIIQRAISLPANKLRMLLAEAEQTSNCNLDILLPLVSVQRA
jgi:hypothetical protein